MRAKVERRSKRWSQQRWLLDTVLATIGVEWDQERLAHYARPAGPAAGPLLVAFGALAGHARNRADARVLARDLLRGAPAGLDEGLLSLSLSNLLCMENHYSLKSFL